ncbi:hypothetical protein V2S66_22605 [Streptomyces sp. V4-01]|uniref:Uncharacterized protein n=1 Tax=Actinacidiphila polyblastidii TaxID=3110430 RepID=A0ABU7PG15_9ACTN|nr:hypothetical protein [Streptomyces sp. V4-01]
MGTLSGDGSCEVVARDARGGLWKFTDWDGSLSHPVWEGGGWQMYTHLL